jgi:thiosulfate/3-mercaptopyruvate sulfurtransferase
VTIEQGNAMTDKPILLVAQVVHERIHNQDWVVADCRFDLSDPAAGRRNYGQNHIPGAVFLDLEKDLAGPVTPDTGRHPLPEVESIVATLGALGIGNSSNVVVYDQDNGATAARAWWILRWLGHESVFLLDGGLSRWQKLGLPLESTKVKRISTEYRDCLQADRVLSTAELEDNVGEIHSQKLLDARDRRRFLGAWEPIDPVAGHVPGSICLPFTDFLREDGTWLPLDERTALLENVLGPDKDVDWSVMCGSGVTACHLAISGMEAGYKEPRLYVGSWSEWIRSPDRPIGTGASPKTGGQTADLK